MAKALLICIAFLALLAIILNYRLDNALNEIIALQGEKTALKMQVETNGRIINAYNQKILDASKQIAELKETALESGDSCYNQPIAPALRAKLRKSRSNTDNTGKDNK
nr:MAG TPA: Protein of unknown function (DUF2570) [Caudoviricetes sp.]